ncbi:exo-alpha-sialidase [Litoribacter alkaliphilus]|uniref:Exo-alpha-sialidase n=1 Tax=Litoribacter ruber TaxID=702568 RepID=A0AAP2G3I1_9BACT|nr:exo-alpha-sialidase [Litoribacter alkaliphilus]MBS9523026.1 exo-alpha-sialidase [Litoribacter alkaliphilus]
MNKSILTIVTMLLIVGCNQEKASEKNETPAVTQLQFDMDQNAKYGQPYLYSNQADVVMMSFIKTEGDQHSLFYTYLQNNEWSEPQKIATGSDWFVNWADYPQISSFKENSLISFFLQKSGEGVYSYDIKLSHSEGGNTWSDPHPLHDDGKEAEHGFVSFVPYEDKMLAAWLDGRNTAGGHDAHHGHNGGAMTLRAALLDKHGNKPIEWELDDKVCDCCQTSATLTSKGPVIVYRDRSDEEVRNISIVRYVDGEWTSPRPVYPDNWKIPGCPVNGPRIDGKGNLLGVAWFAAPNGRPEVKVAFSQDAGENFKQPIPINSGNTIGRVDFTLIDEESGIVSWMEGADILARKINVDGNVGPIVQIASSSDQRSSGFPQMTKSGDKLVFAWTDTKKDNSEILTAQISVAAF